MISKDYEILSAILKIFQSGLPENELFESICSIIPEVYNAEKIYCKITFDNQEFKSVIFKETSWITKKTFELPNNKQGIIEIYFDDELIEEDPKKVFLKNDILIEHISVLISGFFAKNELKVLSYEHNERKKEAKGIHLITQILEKGHSIESALQEICSFLPEAWQYPEYTAARVQYDGKTFTTINFRETPWTQIQTFETYEKKRGSLEIFYLKEFPTAEDGPFLKEERNLLDNLSALISGAASKEALKKLLYQNTERLKELKGLNQTSAILQENRSMEETLQMICTILPEAWQYPEFTCARITYEKKIFTSANFKETRWIQKQPFEAPNNKKGLIEIFYIKEFPKEDEGPFLKEERNLLINLANLIAGSATKDVFNKLLHENKERLKELKGINQTSLIIAENKTIEETLQAICNILPASYQYPQFTAALIRYGGKTYYSKRFKSTKWSQKEYFSTIDNRKGFIEVFYLKEFPFEYEGPFLKEERQLLVNIGKLISGYINSQKGRELYNKQAYKYKETTESRPEEYRQSLIRNKQPLQLFFNKRIIDKYIYFDMMKYKVKEILFVATLYDAFILENEDSFFEQFMGEIYQYSLFSLPRITGVVSPEEALELLDTTPFDIAVLMVGIDQEAPIELSEKIKQKKPDLPIYLLLNQKSNIRYFEEITPLSNTIDKLFTWNGDSQIFFAMVKSTEDYINVDNDTKIGLVRVILLIEDSVQYYSKYLQMLYSIVFGRVQQLLTEVEKNELDKICKMRSRPKIILAKNYEEASYILRKYQDFMLCVITDMEFDKDGKLDKTAGINFIKYAQSRIRNLPIILQSAEDTNERIAKELGVFYINKNSESLLSDLRKFLTFHLGFGDFIFRDMDGSQIAVARSLKEFLAYLKIIPDDALFNHAINNQFSLWVMGRGEIHLAKILNPVKASDFENVETLRNFLVNTVTNYIEEKKRGKILGFEEACIIDEKNIVSFASGSLGGKGRGLAFINSLIYNLDFPSVVENMNIRAPRTAIIGTDEFELFLDRNRLFDKIVDKKTTYREIREYFFHGTLSESIVHKLEVFIDQIHTPIAVRSSSLSEDSINQPFAGVFDTYIIPNNHPNRNVRLQELIIAIKLVYSSIYSDNARTYFKAINHKIEDEKMAVVLQELIGQQFENYYYPHISGIASSYNYYPIANMKPEEGFAVAAVGLGFYVVQGGNAYRFSPKYPKVPLYTTKDLLESSQAKFLAVDLNKTTSNFLTEGEFSSIASLEISEAEKHGTLKHCVSVYNINNDRLEDGLSGYGPRIINFANILKYNYIPLAETIDIMLHTVKEAMGCPVEIEYAVDLTPTINNLPSFYLLQIKPLVGVDLNFEFDINSLDSSKILLHTASSLGNGTVEAVNDIIFVDIHNFDKMKTIEMAMEIDELNKKMILENKKYVLIGPGRWGTSDRFLGVPVIWPQISNAKIIVEISLENFPLDSSLGSHFFHNVTSMNVGYFSVSDTSKTEYIKWEALYNQKIVTQTRHFIHISFENPLTILMNGKKKTSVILMN
jgi:hypothetical protein